MSAVWTQWREDLLSDCIVSPDVFHQMVERLVSLSYPIKTHSRPRPPSTTLHLYLREDY